MTMTLSSPGYRANGFTLLEVLVAVIILGLTVTTLFQLISGTSKLNLTIRTRIHQLVRAEQIWNSLQGRDILADDFPWQGTSGPFSWSLVLSPVREGKKETLEKQEQYQQTSVLYRYVFLFKRQEQVLFRFTLYKSYPLNFLSNDFLEEHQETAGQQGG